MSLQLIGKIQNYDKDGMNKQKDDKMCADLSVYCQDKNTRILVRELTSHVDDLAGRFHTFDQSQANERPTSQHTSEIRIVCKIDQEKEWNLHRREKQFQFNS